MDTPGIADILTTETTPAPAVPETVGAEAVATRSVHRFDVDPASSPAMMAAFAWNRVVPGR